MQKWGNGVVIRIKNKLRKELEATESMLYMEMDSRVRGEHSVQLSNSRCLVVNLSNRVVVGAK